MLPRPGVLRVLPRLRPSVRVLSTAARMSSTDPSLAAAAQAPRPWPGPRDYAGAVAALNLLQSNASMLDARRAAGPRFDDRIPAEVDSLRRIGHAPADLSALNVVHITGTKGKGSTASFTDAVLRTRLARTSPAHKVGLYTSPHMISVRERIRINGRPLREDLFTKYFFQVWDRLGSPPTEQYGGTDVGHASWPLRPFYFRFLTLLMWHVFLSEKVDAAIIEVGIGGRFDSTNVVPRPVATGVTSLGIDHTFLLGTTLDAIAWQKGGIYKPGVPAVATFQATEDAEAVLRKCAQDEKASSFTLLRQGVKSAIAAQVDPQGGLGLPGQHQTINAALAVSLVRAFLAQRGGEAPAQWETDLDALPLSDEEIKGLVSARWPGRCQVVRPPASSSPGASSAGSGGVLALPGARQTTFYLDGAHTTDSLALCAQWFVPQSQKDAPKPAGAGVGRRPVRALIFNCTNGRSVPTLLHAILAAVETALGPAGTVAAEEPAAGGSGTPFPLARNYFDAVFFTTNETYASGSRGDMVSNTTDKAELAALTVQHELRDEWLRLLGVADGTPAAQSVRAVASVEDALRGVAAAAQGKPAQTLVSGSLLLVGGVIAHLKEAGRVDEALTSVY